VLAESAGGLRLVAIGEADRLAREEMIASGETPEENEDKATLMREVTGFKPAPPPKSIYMYSGDKVETIRVRN
jgi:pilus assembly protein CpaB